MIDKVDSFVLRFGARATAFGTFARSAVRAETLRGSFALAGFAVFVPLSKQWS
jgi:hypothetical protein